MSIYLGAGDTAHQLSKLYVGVNGQARQVQKVYVGVNGQARLVYQSGTPIGSLAVGSIVKIGVDGVSIDFIVVQQGNPDTSTYDTSCDGTWLLVKDIYTSSVFNTNGENYANKYIESSVHGYLNNTFFYLIDEDIRSAIKQVKIPYVRASTDLCTGANGLETKVFLLSGYEVGWTNSTSSEFQKDGVKLEYFLSGSGTDAKNRRVAYHGSSRAGWWLRSPNNRSKTIWYVRYTGDKDDVLNGVSYGVRPAFILKSDTLVDESGNVMG